jgi:MSHA biogenesis protein MshQ
MKLVDASFAAVDAADGSSAAERTIESAVLNVGRFVPDHFDLATASTPVFKTFNEVNANCLAPAKRSFTYVGQPFGYVTLPEATIAAKNAAGDTTVNYAGALWKLAAAGVTTDYVAVTGTVDDGLEGTPTVTPGSGVGSVVTDASPSAVIAFARGMPVAPFSADITLTMSIEDAAENGVPGNGTILTATPAVFSSIAFDAGNGIRFGQLVLSNAHGSELLALPVPIETRYWTAAGFVLNADDHCTQLAATHVALSNWQRNLDPCETSVTLSGRFNGGRGNLRFSAPVPAPAPGNTGSVDLTLQLDVVAAGSTCVGGAVTATAAASQSWLQGHWSGTPVQYTQNPSARASFGLHRGSKPLIYLREMW